jgi:hypothetical protein
MLNAMKSIITTNNHKFPNLQHIKNPNINLITEINHLQFQLHYQSINLI